jgi:predicted exporter
MLVVRTADEQAALRELEALEPALQALVASGAIGGYDHAARYVPAAETQRARQARLPETAALRAFVASAQAGTQFRPGVFEPFVADVARARVLPPLTVETLDDSPLGARVETLLVPSDTGTTALVTLGSVRDVAAKKKKCFRELLSDKKRHFLYTPLYTISIQKLM